MMWCVSYMPRCRRKLRVEGLHVALQEGSLTRTMLLEKPLKLIVTVCRGKDFRNNVLCIVKASSQATVLPQVVGVVVES